jgi:hypothetical protein
MEDRKAMSGFDENEMGGDATSVTELPPVSGEEPEKDDVSLEDIVADLRAREAKAFATSTIEPSGWRDGQGRIESHVLEAATLPLHPDQRGRQRELERSIMVGLQQDGPEGFVAFKEAINVYVDLKEHHLPEFPEFAYSVKLPWVLSSFTEEEHAIAKARMTEEQRAAMDAYRALVDSVLVDA